MIENMTKDKAKICRESTAEVEKLIGELPENPN